MKLSQKKKIALVLSGGGVKAAAFHLGVCLALKEKGFKFAGGSPEEVSAHYPNSELTIRFYVGSSAGSVISTFLAAGHSLNSIIHAFEQGTQELSLALRTNEHVDEELRPISYRDLFTVNGKDLINLIPGFFKKMDSMVSGGFEVLLKNGFKLNGLFSTKGLERYIREEVCPSNSFSSLGVDLYIVATQLNHSRKVIFCQKDELSKDKSILYTDYATISEAVAASAAIPPVYGPFPIKNRAGETIYFFDGEIRDTLSTHIAADHGADLVISSYSIQPYHFNSKMGSLHQYGIPVIVNQALYQAVQQKIEKHRSYQRSISSIYQAVDGYLKQVDVASEHREKLLSIIEERANFRPDVDYIYMHPDPEDYKTFFADHFSLNPSILKDIVHSGFRAGIQNLRKLDL